MMKKADSPSVESIIVFIIIIVALCISVFMADSWLSLAKPVACTAVIYILSR